MIYTEILAHFNLKLMASALFSHNLNDFMENALNPGRLAKRLYMPQTVVCFVKLKLIQLKYRLYCVIKN